MAMVVEIVSRCADLIARSLREPAAIREVGGLGDQLIRGVGVVREAVAVGVLLVLASLRCGYCCLARAISRSIRARNL